MDYQFIVTSALETAVTLVLPFVGGYAIKWLRTHIGEKRTNLILNEVRAVVGSVQQMADSGQIDKKNKFYIAYDYVAKHYHDLPDDKIVHYIESAVRNLNTWDTPAILTSSTPYQSVDVVPATPTADAAPVVAPAVQTPIIAPGATI